MSADKFMLETPAGIIHGDSINELSKAISKSLPINCEQVKLKLIRDNENLVRICEFTYTDKGYMFETYGSRPVLNFNLLLSRVYWTPNNSGLLRRVHCFCLGCRLPETNTADFFCTRCYVDGNYISNNSKKAFYFGAFYERILSDLNYKLWRLRKLFEQNKDEETPF